jgi:serine/threonine protein kinase
VDLLQPGDPGQVGPFRLLGRLGEGGMGRVFLGESPGGRKVAIKVVHPHYASDPEFRRRFAREVAAARQVGGFHTAAVVGADPGADPPWMATAYIPGPSLAQAVAEGGPLDQAEVRRLGASLAEGLAAIHDCGLIHRDLKPSNVILADDGPRIIDFGIAKGAAATVLTGSSAVIGTLRHMSPEQLQGQELTPQSDVFALGTVLAYAATGHDPFEAPTIPAVITRILTGPPDLGLLAGDLRAVIADCLAKEPGSRPGSGEILARFSRPGSHDSTVIAAPHSARVTAPVPEPPPAGPDEPERPAADEPPGDSTIDIAVAGRFQHPTPAPQVGDAPAAARLQLPRRYRRRTGLIAASVIAAGALAAVAAFALDKHPASTLSAAHTHLGNSPSATHSRPAVSPSPTPTLPATSPSATGPLIRTLTGPLVRQPHFVS